MLVMRPWPDPNEVLWSLLEGLTDHEVVTSLPADLAAALPLIRSRRVGGGADRISSTPRVDVEVYAGTYDEAMTLAQAAEQLVIGPRRSTGQGLIDRAETEVGPSERTYPNPAVHLVAATYRLVLRRGGRSYQI